MEVYYSAPRRPGHREGSHGLKTVFKYSLSLDDIIEVEVPIGSQLLHVGLQDGRLMLWALVDTAANPCIKRVRCAGTGHKIVEDDLRFIDTVHMVGGRLIFHFFEVLEP